MEVRSYEEDKYGGNKLIVDNKLYSHMTSIKRWVDYYEIKVNEAKNYLDSFSWSPEAVKEVVVYSHVIRQNGRSDPEEYRNMYQTICDKIEEETTDDFYFSRVDETPFEQADWDDYVEDYVRYDLIFESNDQEGYKSSQAYKQGLKDYQETLEAYNKEALKLQQFFESLTSSLVAV